MRKLGNNFLYGVLMIFTGLVIVILKLTKKWIFDENKNVYESALAVRGWIGAILLVLAGIFLLIGKN